MPSIVKNKENVVGVIVKHIKNNSYKLIGGMTQHIRKSVVCIARFTGSMGQ